MEGTTPVARKAGMTSPLRQADGSDRSAEGIAYPVLYRHLLPRTLRWLRQFGVADRHREDVAQEVWIRVLRTLEHFESDRPFEPWLMTITFRAACDHLKRADVRHERLSEAGEVEPQATPATEDLVIDAVHTLETLLQRLTPDHRTVLMMVDGEELAPADVAEALGVSLNTVYSRLSRARVQFQRALARLRAAEQQRLGAVVVLPAFLLDGRALFDAGREVPPVSVETEARIWDGIQRGLDAPGASDERGADIPPGARRRAGVPPPDPPGASSSWRGLARWPWSSPVGLAATMILSGLGGGGIVAWWMRGPAAPAAIVQEEARSAMFAGTSAAPSATGDTAPAASSTVPASSSSPAGVAAPAYDPREELSTLEAAYTLYVQGHCEAARAKLGKRAGRVHENDYRELRRKIETCLARDGGTP